MCQEKRDGSFDDTFKEVTAAGVVHHWDGSGGEQRILKHLMLSAVERLWAKP